MNPLQKLHEAGQSVWLDFITRDFISDGHLAKLIREDGICGVTSNPTIFEKAFAGGHAYDKDIAALIRQGQASDRIFWALAIQDIQHACDAFRAQYASSQGRDGYVSLEVDPHLARDSQKTLQGARRLYKEVNRPNVMIKIPGTVEGLTAIEQALGDGININVTLIFSLERYAQVMEAWLKGLEQAARTGHSLKAIASVASFFVSRVDTLVDDQLQKKGKSALQGKAAIANAQKAYAMFEVIRNGTRFQALAKQGAMIQRPLWASTSTKNPNYRDVLYVEELIGQDTVNTLPLPTVDAFRDHGQVRAALPVPVATADKTLEELAQAGIDINAVTRQLEEEGLKSFAASYDSLLKSLEEKKEKLKVGA